MSEQGPHDVRSTILHACISSNCRKTLAEQKRVEREAAKQQKEADKAEKKRLKEEKQQQKVLVCV
jgi:hypothetical protein